MSMMQSVVFYSVLFGYPKVSHFHIRLAKLAVNWEELWLPVLPRD